MKEFNISTLTRPALPRSERLRGTGGSVSAPGTGTRGTDGGAVPTDVEHAKEADYAREAGHAREADHSKEADHALAADTAEVARDLTDDSPAWDEMARRYLSRLDDDTAQGLIKLMKGADFGDFTSGMVGGFGGRIDGQGNGEMQSLRVRGTMEVMELLINRVRAIGGQLVVAEGDTVERVERDPSNPRVYTLFLKEQAPGCFTEQAEGNILQGRVSAIADGSITESWMRVLSVNPAANTLTVLLYDDADTPNGANHPPCEMMNVVRRGNADPSDTQRSSVIVISSPDRRILFLDRVHSPKTTADNVAACIGIPPESIASQLGSAIIPGQMYLYARGMIARDVIRWGPELPPEQHTEFRGLWQQGQTYYCGDTRDYAPHDLDNFDGTDADGTLMDPTSSEYLQIMENRRAHTRAEVSEVSHLGCVWRCVATHTSDATNAPRWDAAMWLMVSGDPEFRLEFTDLENLYDADDFAPVLEVRAVLHNQDVTADVADTDWMWTRTTAGPDGQERTLSDNAWAAATATRNPRNRVALTLADLDLNGYTPHQMKTVRFTCRATLRDGATASNSVDIG